MKIEEIIIIDGELDKRTLKKWLTKNVDLTEDEKDVLNGKNQIQMNYYKSIDKCNTLEDDLRDKIASELKPIEEKTLTPYQILTKDEYDIFKKSIETIRSLRDEIVKKGKENDVALNIELGKAIVTYNNYKYNYTEFEYKYKRTAEEPSTDFDINDVFTLTYAIPSNFVISKLLDKDGEINFDVKKIKPSVKNKILKRSITKENEKLLNISSKLKSFSDQQNKEREEKRNQIIVDQVKIRKSNDNEKNFVINKYKKALNDCSYTKEEIKNLYKNNIVHFDDVMISFAKKSILTDADYTKEKIKNYKNIIAKANEQHIEIFKCKYDGKYHDNFKNPGKVTFNNEKYQAFLNISNDIEEATKNVEILEDRLKLIENAEFNEELKKEKKIFEEKRKTFNKSVSIISKKGSHNDRLSDNCECIKVGA